MAADDDGEPSRAWLWHFEEAYVLAARSRVHHGRLKDADGGVVGVVEWRHVAQAGQTLAAWALLHGVGPPVAVGPAVKEEADQHARGAPAVHHVAVRDGLDPQTCGIQRLRLRRTRWNSCDELTYKGEHSLCVQLRAHVTPQEAGEPTDHEGDGLLVAEHALVVLGGVGDGAVRRFARGVHPVRGRGAVKRARGRPRRRAGVLNGQLCELRNGRGRLTICVKGGAQRLLQTGADGAHRVAEQRGRLGR